MDADRETDVAARIAAVIAQRWLIDGPDGGVDATALVRELLPVVDAIVAERVREAKAEVWSLAASWVGPPFAQEFRDRAAALRGPHA